MEQNLIVWRESQNVANAIGTCLELFADCEFKFFDNAGKRPNYQFTNKQGDRAIVLLSSALIPEYESGALDKASILKLPVYVTDIFERDDSGNFILDDEGAKIPVLDEKGNQLQLMTAGKPQTAGRKVSDLKSEKIKDFEPVAEDNWDDYI